MAAIIPVLPTPTPQAAMQSLCNHAGLIPVAILGQILSAFVSLSTPPIHSLIEFLPYHGS